MEETHFDLKQFKLAELLKIVLEILTHPVFLCSALVPSMIYAVLILFGEIGPFLVQRVLKYSPITYGKVTLYINLMCFLGTFFAGFLIYRFKPMQVALIGIIGALSASIGMVMCVFILPINLYTIVIPVSVIGFFCMSILPNMAVKCVKIFPNYAGTTSSIYGACVSLGVSFITTILTYFGTNTQLPIVLTYFVILSLCIVFYFISLSLEKKQFSETKLLKES